MSLFSRLFGAGGGSSKPEPEREAYEGYLITPTPLKDGSAYRLRAEIVPEGGGEPQTIIRADTFQAEEEARAAAVRKAKQVIDEQARLGRGSVSGAQEPNGG